MEAAESVDRKHHSPLARFARTLMTPRGGVTLLLGAVLCLGGNRGWVKHRRVFDATPQFLKTSARPDNGGR